MMLAARFVAIVSGTVVAATATERICWPPTVIPLTDVLLVPEMVMVVWRGDGILGNVKGVLDPVDSTWIAWQLFVAGVADVALAEVVHQRKRAGSM